MYDSDFLNQYFKDFSWVAAGMGLAMVVDLVFYIFAGRWMTPTQFGYFGIITSLYYIFLRSPFRSIEITSKKLVAEGEDSMDLMGIQALFLGLTVFFLFLVFSSPLSSILEIPVGLVIVFSFVFPLGYLVAVMVGKLQGEEDYRHYGMYEFISSFTAFFTLLLVFIGFGASGATLMFVVEIIAGFIIIWKLKGFSIVKEEFDQHDVLFRSFVFILGIHAAFSLDMIAVQYFFSSEITGFYNTVSVFGKGLFFGAVAVNRSVFPKFVINENDRWKNLALSQLLVVLGGSFAAVFFWLVGDVFIKYTFGTNYLQATEFAPPYMIMISVISSVALMANYCISVDIKAVALVGFLPLIQVALVSFFHESVLQIIYSTTLASLLILGTLGLFIWKARS